MIRKGMWKYIHYSGLNPSLYDLECDPEEENDLGTNPEFSEIPQQLHSHLPEICDPEDVEKSARRDQAEIIERNGGVEQSTGLR